MRCLGHDVALRQQSQTQQVSELTRIRFVTSMLEPVVLFNGGGVGQMNAVSRLLQAIDQPVPIKCGFNHHAVLLSAMQFQRREYLRQIIGESF